MPTTPYSRNHVIKEKPRSSIDDFGEFKLRCPLIPKHLRSQKNFKIEVIWTKNNIEQWVRITLDGKIQTKLADWVKKEKDENNKIWIHISAYYERYVFYINLKENQYAMAIKKAYLKEHNDTWQCKIMAIDNKGTIYHFSSRKTVKSREDVPTNKYYLFSSTPQPMDNLQNVLFSRIDNDDDEILFSKHLSAYDYKRLRKEVNDIKAFRKFRNSTYKMSLSLKIFVAILLYFVII
uniref:DOMON domain-containing protein n=1 Tax=Strongyloides venezuelensis TaxID=75913 RepID=A0A0K0F0X9_STRVS